MPRILVTGASGLLGLNLALQACDRADVFGTVFSQELAKVPFKVIRADLIDEHEFSACMDESRPDIIFNCAALANLEACESDPLSARELNAALPERLALISRRRSIKLVHVSTDAVFDGQQGNYSENDLPNPLSVYAKTKLEGEQAVLQSDSRALVVRVNFFGYSLAGKRSLAEFFLYNLAAGTRVFGFNDVLFCPLLVQHLNDILLEMVSKDLKGLFHVVSPQCLSKYEFGVKIAKLFGLNDGLVESASINRGGLKAPRSLNITLNIDKLKGSLGHPIPDLQSSLEKFHQLFVEGYPQKLEGYRAVKDLVDGGGDE